MPGKQSSRLPESGATNRTHSALWGLIVLSLFFSFPHEPAPEASLWPAIWISDLENSERIDKLLQIEEGVRDSRGSKGNHQGCAPITAQMEQALVRILPTVSGTPLLKKHFQVTMVTSWWGSRCTRENACLRPDPICSESFNRGLVTLEQNSGQVNGEWQIAKQSCGLWSTHVWQ